MAEIVVRSRVYCSKHDDNALVIHNGVVRFEKWKFAYEDCLYFSNVEEVEGFERMYGVAFPLFPSLKFRKAYANLCNDQTILTTPSGFEFWEDCLGPKHFLSELQIYAMEIEKVVSGVDTSFWTSYHERFQRMLGNPNRKVGLPIEGSLGQVGLANAFLSRERLLELRALPAISNGGTLACLRDIDFASNQVREVVGRGVVEVAPPCYSVVNTRTGRMTIRRGLDILTLKKEYRDILVSKFGEDGKVWYFDYSSLEPRVLLILARELAQGTSPNPSLIGNVPQRSASSSPPEDIYSNALEDLGLAGKVPRHIAKTAILSFLYGQGEDATADTLRPYISKPEEFISALSDYFGIDALKQKLAGDFVKSNGKQISNLYGRPILCEGARPYVLLNYFIQSTAVIVALLGFEAIINRLRENDLADMIRPIFFLHDAILIDIHNDLDYVVPKLERLGSTGIPKFKNHDFFLKAQTLESLLTKSQTPIAQANV